MGAKRVIGIDRVPARLAFARDQSGAEVLDFSAPENKDVVKKLWEMVPGGLDVALDCGERIF
jgi:threonine dehydrogenase-like Zn-dependent dehydrogenase